MQPEDDDSILESEIETSFLRHWADVGPPDLATFVRSWGIHRPIDQAQIIQLDQRERTNRGRPIPVEDYLSLLPDVAGDANAVFEVLAHEYVLHHDRDPNLYQRLAERFPQHAAMLAKQVAVYRMITAGRSALDHSSPDEPMEGSMFGRIPIGLEDRFQFEQAVGRGGVGIVYRARDLALGRTVAVKVLDGNRQTSEATYRRFLAEAEIIARLDHPNIVGLFEVVHVADAIALILEYVDGGTLADRIRRSPLPLKEAAQLVRRLALAIQFAHSKGIIHRDLKPGNVLIRSRSPKELTDEGDLSLRLDYIPKLVDFGLAKTLQTGVTQDAHQNITHTGEIVGTPKYLSPEQIRGCADEFLPSIDIHALGVILFESLTGESPFSGPTVVDYLRQIVEEQVQFPSRSRKSLPRDLQVICSKALEKDPRERYESAEALADDLGRFIRDEPILARSLSTFGSVMRWCGQHPGVAGLVASVGVLLILLAAGSLATATIVQREGSLARQAEHRAIRIEQERREQLFRSLIENARSTAFSNSIGQRLQSTKLLASALAIRSLRSLTKDEQSDVASIAAHALARVDATEILTIPLSSKHSLSMDACDSELARVVSIEQGSDDPVVRTIDQSSPPWKLAQPGDKFIDSRLVRFSPAGRWIADNGYDGSSHPFRVWNTNSHHIAWSVRSGPILTSFAFHPDNRHLVYCLGARLHVVDLEQGVEVSQSPPRFVEGSLAYSPNGASLALTSRSTGLQVIDCQSWESRAIPCPAAVTSNPVWTPTGDSLLVGLADGGILSWNTRDDRPSRQPSVGLVPERLCLGSLGEYLAVGDSVNTHIYRLNGFQRLLRSPGQLVGLSETGDRFALREGNQIVVRKIVDSRVWRQVNHRCESATISPDGKVMALAGLSGVSLISADSLTPIVDLGLDDTGPVTFSPAGDELYTFGLFTDPSRWRIQQGNPSLIGPPRTIPLLGSDTDPNWALRPQYRGRQIARSPIDQRLAIVNYREARIEVLDASGTQSVLALKMNRPSLVRWDVHGKFLVAASQFIPRVTVLNGNSLEPLLDLAGHFSVDFSSDGKLLATRTTDSLFVFDTTSWKRLAEIPVCPVLEYASCPILFQPGSHRIAIVEEENSIRLLDVDSQHDVLRLRLDREPSPIRCLSFSVDGRRLVCTRLNLDVHRWDLALLDLQLASNGISLELAPDNENFFNKPLENGTSFESIPASKKERGSREAPAFLSQNAIKASLPVIEVDRGRLPPPGDWYKNWQLLGGYEALRGQWADALVATDHAIECCPSNLLPVRSQLQTQRGDVLWRLGRMTEAIASWRTATEWSMEAVIPRRRLSLVYLLGPVHLRDSKAVFTLMATLQLDDRTRPESQLLTAMALIRLNRNEEGRRLLQSEMPSPEWKGIVQHFIAISYAKDERRDLTDIPPSTPSTPSTDSSKAIDPIGIVDWDSLHSELLPVQ